MSLLRFEDYLLTQSNDSQNKYWRQLIKTIDQFDQLIEIEKKQISFCLKDHQAQRIQLCRKFQEFKDSLKYQGEVPKNQLYFIQSAEFPTFFKDYHQNIHFIISELILSPKRFCKLLADFKDTRKLKFEDFSQNLAFNIYPCYLPLKQKSMNNSLTFIEEAIKLWPYSLKLARPTHYSLIDQVINGFMKTPTIVCYIERIISQFLQNISLCKMDRFAFDETALKSQIQGKKQVSQTISYTTVKKKASMRERIKGWFKGKQKEQYEEPSMRSNISQFNENQFLSKTQFIPENSYLQSGDLNNEKSILEQQKNSFLSQNSQRSDENFSGVDQMMKRRQISIYELINQTVESILNEEVPFLLKQMMVYFDRKITASQEEEGSQIGEGQDYQQKQDSKEKHSKEKEKHSKEKHYCYFMMTNLIFSELHNKFTVSHQDTGMSHADLQNISEIIRILNCIFQGLLPQGQKYKNISYTLKDYRKRVSQFYENLLEEDTGQSVTNQNQDMREILLQYYDQSIVFSLNDIKIIVEIIKQSTTSHFLTSEHKSKYLQFLDLDVGAREIFDLRNQAITFKHARYSSDNIFFMYEDTKPSTKEIIEFYMLAEEPLENIPLIKNLLLYQSNLTVQESLEIDQDLKLIKKLPMKDIKSFLLKMAHKFRHLYVNGSREIDDKFKQCFRDILGHSLKRKQCLLFYKHQIRVKMNSYNFLIDYYTNELNSAQFYQRISESFINSMKIKIYLNIENQLFKVHKNPSELKKLQISNLIVGKDDNKSTLSSEDFILRNSYKMFQWIKDIMRCLAKNQITKTAFQNGRKTEDFHQVFIAICETVVTYIQGFIKDKQTLQALSQDKIANIVVSKMQNMIYFRNKIEKILQSDKKLIEMAHKIDKSQFYSKDLANLGIERQFLVTEGVGKLRLMVYEKDISEKTKHFSELFKIIFTILGFSLSKNKISAEIVNPIMQYLILESAELGHHECLYSLQCLRWKENPQDNYYLILYQSSLTYICEHMIEDYPIVPTEMKEIKSNYQ